MDKWFQHKLRSQEFFSARTYMRAHKRRCLPLDHAELATFTAGLVFRVLLGSTRSARFRAGNRSAIGPLVHGETVSIATLRRNTNSVRKRKGSTASDAERARTMDEISSRNRPGGEIIHK